MKGGGGVGGGVGGVVRKASVVPTSSSHSGGGQGSAALLTQGGKKKEAKKIGSGLNAFKSKISTGKKLKKEANEEISSGKTSTNKDEIKQRLFFIARPSELTDEEVLANIGREEMKKEVGQGLNQIAHAAKYLNRWNIQHTILPASRRFVQNSKDEKEKETPPGFGGLPTSIMYVGALKSRLTKEGDRDRKSSLGVDLDGASTHFLGKMVSQKDKHGLMVGRLDKDDQVLSPDPDENPIVAALDKVASGRTKTSDTGEKSAATPPGSKLDVKKKKDDEDDLRKSPALTTLLTELSTVHSPKIEAWNLHKNATKSRALRPILIPF